MRNGAEHATGCIKVLLPNGNGCKDSEGMSPLASLVETQSRCTQPVSLVRFKFEGSLTCSVSRELDQFRKALHCWVASQQLLSSRLCRLVPRIWRRSLRRLDPCLLSPWQGEMSRLLKREGRQVLGQDQEAGSALLQSSSGEEHRKWTAPARKIWRKRSHLVYPGCQHRLSSWIEILRHRQGRSLWCPAASRAA